jgi:hypothetical protein
MTSGSREQGSSKEESPTVSQPSTVLELQRMALRKALSTLDLEAVRFTCTSCTHDSCSNRPPQE